MDFYSFGINKLKRDQKQDNLYDLFVTTLIDPIGEVTYYPHLVTREENMRLDLLCKNVYDGKTDMIEEIMVFNNIKNPFSIKEGDIIYVTTTNDMFASQVDEQPNDEQLSVVQQLVNPDKSTRKDPNREGTGLTPQIKPAGLKQVQLDYENKKIIVPNTFR